MTDIRDTTAGHRNEWALSQQALQRLLDWLDGGSDSDGHGYVEMRRRLRDYFVRRNCRAADELADETLTRVTRRLEEEGITRAETPARYCYIVARFVFLEHLRETRAHPTIAHDPDDVAWRGAASSAADTEEAASRERHAACLRKCLQDLDPLNRRIITHYYIGRERTKIANRRALAESLGLSSNALAIRAHRIRLRLEACVRRCAAAGMKGFWQEDLSDRRKADV